MFSLAGDKNVYDSRLEISVSERRGTAGQEPAFMLVSWC